MQVFSRPLYKQPALQVEHYFTLKQKTTKLHPKQGYALRNPATNWRTLYTPEQHPGNYYNHTTITIITTKSREDADKFVSAFSILLYKMYSVLTAKCRSTGGT